MILHNRSDVEQLYFFKIIIVIFTVLVTFNGPLAQTGNLAMTTMVGVSFYDLSGTGTAPVSGGECMYNLRVNGECVRRPGFGASIHGVKHL